MRIGVVSDTHNHLGNVERIVGIFNAQAVSCVVHTGDITQAKTLEVFARLEMPLVGVYGNNDLERDSLESAADAFSMEIVDPPRTLCLGSRRLAVVHEPAHIDQEMLAAHDVVLHGHTHRHVCERQRGCLVFNPGECAGMMVGLNAVGVLDLSDLDAKLLRF